MHHIYSFCWWETLLITRKGDHWVPPLLLPLLRFHKVLMLILKNKLFYVIISRLQFFLQNILLHASILCPVPLFFHFVWSVLFITVFSVHIIASVCSSRKILTLCTQLTWLSVCFNCSFPFGCIFLAIYISLVSDYLYSLAPLY